jgi:outer membrane protein TolC
MSQADFKGASPNAHFLIGEMPAALAIDTMPINGEPPRLPPEMPSRLLERRPDIAAAERRVAAANSQIGVATSAFFPTLGISASVGLQTTTLQKLLSWPAGFWSVGPTLAYQLFDGGGLLLTAQQRRGRHRNSPGQ